MQKEGSNWVMPSASTFPLQFSRLLFLKAHSPGLPLNGVYCRAMYLLYRTCTLRSYFVISSFFSLYRKSLACSRPAILYHNSNYSIITLYEYVTCT